MQKTHLVVRYGIANKNECNLSKALTGTCLSCLAISHFGSFLARHDWRPLTNALGISSNISYFFSFLWTISEILWLKIKTCNICLLLDHNSEMECWVGRHLEVWLWLCSASNSWVHYSLEILQTILKTRPIKHALLCNIQFWTATLENKYDPRFMVEYVWFVCARPSYGLYEMLSLNFSESLPSIMINGYGSIMFCQHT